MFSTTWFRYESYKKNCEVVVIYPRLNKLLKTLRKFHLKLKLPLYHIWYTSASKNIPYNETVIIFDSLLTVPFANYLADKRKDLRIIYWFWNHIFDSKIFYSLSSQIEKWSYDRNDCSQFKLKYNTQFVFPELYKTDNGIFTYDTFFIGKSKGRLKKIDTIYSILNEYCANNEFYIIDSKSIHDKKRLSYSDVLLKNSQSKAIVDIILEEQEGGLTLRPLESIFMNRKLITNQKEIIHHDFYNSNNIFIIGVDDLSMLRKFMNNIYFPINQSILSTYCFKNWLNRFCD